MTEKNTLKKSATLAAAGLVVAGALLAGCGESKPRRWMTRMPAIRARPESQEEQSQSQSDARNSVSRFHATS